MTDDLPRDAAGVRTAPAPLWHRTSLFRIGAVAILLGAFAVTSVPNVDSYVTPWWQLVAPAEAQIVRGGGGVPFNAADLTKVQLNDDFCGGNNSAGVVGIAGNLGWTNSNIAGTGTFSMAQGTAPNMCVVDLQSGAVSNDASDLHLSNPASSSYSAFFDHSGTVP